MLVRQVRQLTREAVEQAFDLIGDLAAKDGKVIEIAVYGASYFIFASNIRDVTRDVDDVCLDEHDAVYTLTEKVGDILRLPRNWLIQAVASRPIPRADLQQNLLPLGDYPRSTTGTVGLRVTLPTMEYVLAMKNLANRTQDETVFEYGRSNWTTRTETKEVRAGIVITDLDQRPGTLAEVARRVKANEQSLSVALPEFLDEFYWDEDASSRRARLEDEPGKLGDPRLDAYMAAAAEHLCNRWCLPAPPDWVYAEDRYLRRPWFVGFDGEKAILLAESPSAFRQRFIFIEAEPLRRARMPKDGRWWAYETLRTGLLPPSPEEMAADEEDRRRWRRPGG